VSNRRRWVCPNDCGNNVMAPGRMRRDDVRRYCLPCSESTGRLVERLAPALERVREEKAAARRKRERKAAAAATAKRWCLVDGTDVRPMFRRARSLKVWKREGDGVARAVRKHENKDAAFFGAARTSLVAANYVWRCAWVAARYLDIKLSIDGLALAALSEFFGIPETEILAVQRTTQRLLKGEIVRVDRAAAQCAEARGWVP